jgi:hypothetical protein
LTSLVDKPILRTCMVRNRQCTTRKDNACYFELLLVRRAGGRVAGRDARLLPLRPPARPAPLPLRLPGLREGDLFPATPYRRPTGENGGSRAG